MMACKYCYNYRPRAGGTCGSGGGEAVGNGGKQENLDDEDKLVGHKKRPPCLAPTMSHIGRDVTRASGVTLARLLGTRHNRALTGCLESLCLLRSF